MRMFKTEKAVSTLILIIMILCSFVFGGLISYLWVMANYYNMPEDTTLLVVEDVVFPVFDARYFNVTILNPSNSVSDASVMAIQVTVEGKKDVYNVGNADPSFPFLLKKGTEQTFECKTNWSNFTGETVRVEPVTVNASTRSLLHVTPKAKLNLLPIFDQHQSIEYFNLFIENSESIIDFTISEILFFGVPINATPSLPYVVEVNQTIPFRCDWNWENYRNVNVSIIVETVEGYESVYTTTKLPGAVLNVK